MQGYRETCAELRKKYEHSPNVQEVNTVVWLCALAPDGRQSYSHLIEVFKPLAEQAASKQLEDFHFYLTTLGALQFRAGNFSEAKDWIDRSREMQIRNRENHYPVTLVRILGSPSQRACKRSTSPVDLLLAMTLHLTGIGCSWR